jgi:hypothetical protein
VRKSDVAAAIRRLLLCVLLVPTAALAQTVVSAPAASASVSTNAPATALPSGGPLNLLISYRSEPANRPAFRAYLQKEGR